MKLKYKGNFEDNEVWIRLNHKESYYIADLLTAVGFDMTPFERTWPEDYVDEDTGEVVTMIRREILMEELKAAIGDVIRVKFYIYKKKESWVSLTLQDKQYTKEFVYDIKKLTEMNDARKVIGYELQFSLLEGFLRKIPVKFDCAPKKILVKYLLDDLIKDYSCFKK